MPVYRLSQELIFPPPDLAVEEGLLAVGGDLSEKRLLIAYSMGIFPWYNEDEPILWWSPDPRMVLYPEEIHISRSLQRLIRRRTFSITMDQDFEGVIHACSAARGPGRPGTWIVPEMIDAYCQLHASGFAHSVEAWVDGRLAGGLYGVSLGRCFFGESMFTWVDNASKVALVYLTRQLQQWNFAWIDCQVITDHMKQFGARLISRAQFLEELELALHASTRIEPWRLAITPDDFG